MISFSEVLNIALENIIIGAVAAGIVGLASYTRTEIKNKVIEKRFPVEGEYISTFEDEKDGQKISRKAPVELNQSGNEITGTTYLPDAKTKEWNIEGNIHRDHQYINGIYHASNPRDEGVGNFFLYLNSDGSMEGLWSGYDDVNDKINSGRYIFRPITDEFTINELRESDIPSVVNILEEQIGRDYISVELFKKSIEPDSNLFTLTATREPNSMWLNNPIINNILPNIHKFNQTSHTQIETQNTNIVGFCIGAAFDKTEFTNYLNIPEDDLPPAFNVSSKIGVIRTVAVKDKFTQQGIGTKMVEECINRCVDEGATVLCSVGWKDGDQVNIGGIMEHFGFSREKKFDNYWHDESINREYHCTNCGEPPCTCSAVLFAKYPGS